MRLFSTHPLPGNYQYTYPTFIDTPQQICVHFITPDQQKAFVSYPHHRNHKAARLIDIRWFKSVDLVKLDGQPQLMHFLAVTLPGWFNNRGPKLVAEHSLVDNLDAYALRLLRLA